MGFYIYIYAKLLMIAVIFIIKQIQEQKQSNRERSEIILRHVQM